MRSRIACMGMVWLCGTAWSQEFVAGSASVSTSASTSASYLAALRPARTERPRAPGWLWVHTGVAINAAGSFADWATSWKQPEGNSWLAEGGGAYAGRFYRTGTARKIGLSAGLAALSYGLAWKWPRARKYIGIFNMSVGVGFGSAAVANTIRNPYYKP